jgi:PST family polysaccharide transporter
VFKPSASAENDELRQLAVRGAGVTIFAGGAALAIQVIATVVLARLLTPTDFGVVAMVTTFSYLLVNFGLNGLTEAVVQREEISHELASSLFWVNLSCGALLTLGFAGAGSLLAWFYKNPHVQLAAVGISITIFLTSASVMHLALLKRAMRFSRVSLNDIRARIVAVAVSILLGWAGWGYWALIAGAIALSLSTTLGAWSLCRWMPGRPRRVEGLTSMMRFALHTYGSFTVNYGSRNTDNLLVGWRFSAQSLGYYKKAYDLFALSATQLVASISVVVVAALSRVSRDMPQYRRYFLGAVTVMAFVGMGVGVDLTLVGQDLIRVLLGPGWAPAGRIFTFFGPGIGVMIIYYTHGWIHLSIGRPDRWFRWGIVEFVITVTLFLLALSHGPIGIAVAWTASFWILTIPAIWYAGRPIGLSVVPVLAVIWRYLVASLVAGIATSSIISHFPTVVGATGAQGALLRIVLVSLLVGIVYLGAVVTLHGGFGPVQQMLVLLREMIGRGGLVRITPVAATASAGGNLATNSLTVDQPERSNSEPLVSILVPAYNAEEWIADTLRSAIAQTWERKEIIVVDDGSSDRTFDIACQFKSETVIVVQQKNQGAAAARNTALSLSHGDYIQWLDADDLLVPDKIASQMKARNQCAGKRTLLSGPWGAFMYRPHRAQFTPTSLWSDLSPVEWLLHKLSENCYMQTATWLVSRELTEAAGLWDTRLIGDDDGEYFCRVLLASEGVHFVPNAKVYYRTFGFNNLSYIGNNPRKINAHWLSMKMHIGYLRSLEESPRVHAACLTYLRTSLIYFYPERSDIVEEAEEMARELGEQLGLPHLAWKYSWIERLFGWRLAKPVQRHLRRIRWSIEKRIDKLVSLSESGDRLIGARSNSPTDPMTPVSEQ